METLSKKDKLKAYNKIWRENNKVIKNIVEKIK